MHLRRFRRVAPIEERAHELLGVEVLQVLDGLTDADVAQRDVEGPADGDDDAALGSSLHDYRVVAVDTDGNLSDTLSIAPFGARAATLALGRILAVNRTQVYSNDFVDEKETGEYMRLVLDGYDYDYFSDTTAVSGYRDCNSVELNEKVQAAVKTIAMMNIR